MSNNLDKTSAKILVLGDSGVGKSSLIHLICHSAVLSSAQWTIGCSIDVKLHDNCFLEFWDIGGSRSHKIARSFLYQDYHGIILVFDATNIKSRVNLDEWLAEVTGRDSANVPTITIGTKSDQLTYGSYGSTFSPLLVTNHPVIYINTQDPLSFDPSSENYGKLNNYFKSVLERRTNKRYYNKFAI
uniref:Rab-like protein 3 n=1 Tax=Aceria tosichella TaxID=561515 RepID=A0A6G1SPQ6_9ACAR